MRTEKKIGKRNILKDIGMMLTIAAICTAFATVVSATSNNQEDKFQDSAPLQNA